MTIDEYNEQLKAFDRVRMSRKSQPKGLANYAVMKKAQENAALAPYTIEKSQYYKEYIVRKGAAVYGAHNTKREAVAWIMAEKAKA